MFGCVNTGTAAPGFVETAFTTLVPNINDIGSFINKQTGGKLSYLVNTLIAGSPGARLPPASNFCCSPLGFWCSDAAYLWRREARLAGFLDSG